MRMHVYIVENIPVCCVLYEELYEADVCVLIRAQLLPPCRPATHNNSTRPSQEDELTTELPVGADERRRAL